MTSQGLHLIRGVSHAVFRGRHDDRAEECSFRFWRCGKGFEISVHGRDVDHTEFHQLWHQLVDDNSLQNLSRFDKWFRLCELILNECQDLLEELAPAGSEWKTLGDVLHCPTYTLKLSKTGTDMRVAAHLVAGPVDKPAYDMLPVHVSDMDTFARNLPVCGSESVLPGSWLGHSPGPVRGPDGRLYTLVLCEHRALDAQRGEADMPSWDRIRAYVHLANSVLTDYIDSGSSVQGLVEAAVSAEQLLSLEHKLALWRDRVALTVTTLHEHGITLTTSEYGSTIHELNIEINQHDQVYMPLSFGTVSIGVGQGELEHRTSDMNELSAVFDERLPNLINEARRRLTPA
ncbi:hypothetical protein LTR91_008375 [Friedmanniomyces endolithicus]|uniref:Uncharacterized protein n=1 Tax=Friedmanniomyces endolithicus TaxID=329885 RepID=A0AAN6KP07_9PEZI|nr:hypothetical protein LTR94_023307 [Friedmanniomyces endolithicus]KAK0789623.1 hypothetical protein LTR75_012304 [Friedmanniomyces endolithicus]KAK0839037.1 hypothetical protein LTS02_017607 [Friedmanniomyces endolithicus]KAK0850906.1 hypothetical protein LTR03_004416 [Friedmanniomyces endolithicus]KAK0889672.1 hypothetical protein LTR57_025316 [Friedmanniomyces endolithicus]